MTHFLRYLTLPVLFHGLVMTGGSEASEGSRSPREIVAASFEGLYRFNYLFVEEGVPYFDEISHVQQIEVEELPNKNASRVSFFNLFDGKKQLHFSYVIYEDGEQLRLEELDAQGEHRFDCFGTYDPKRKLFDCRADNAPKPARDRDSELTRALDLYRRPTTWPDYQTLDRHNLFRFYEWGFTHLQENTKLDAQGKPVAHETGVITALEVASATETRK